MNTRERFNAVMNFEPFDRLPVLEWAPWWDKTIERWRAEGLPAALSGEQINEHFGLDQYLMNWPSVRQPSCPQPETMYAGICRDAGDYERLLPHLYPEPAVDRPRWEYMAAKQAEGDAVAWMLLDGFFWHPRQLLGVERHMYAFYDQPDLLHRMNEDLSDWLLRVIDELLPVCTPDVASFEEDMSYNHGPMLSKAMFDEFMMPYYHKVIPRLKDSGVLVLMDSDGDVSTAAEWFADAGVDGIFPLERQSGVDVAALRDRLPRMRLLGAYDKMVMNHGEAAMRAEFERLLPLAAGGGFVIGCDHQTPPGVSYQDYMTYLNLFMEYAEKAGGMSRSIAEPGAEGDGQ